jgi:hypothetical protein
MRDIKKLIENTINEYLNPSYQLQMENYDESNYDESKEIQNIPVDVMWEYREFNRCDDDNDNIKGDAYIEKLTNDIKQNGVKYPIILQIDDENKGLIIEGNHRLCISIKLGLKTIPVKIIYDNFGSDSSIKHKAKPIRNNIPKGYLIKSNKPNEGETKEKDFGFRSGHIEGNKPEDMQRMDSNRSTGHFGTGYYFFGDEDSAKKYQKNSGGRDIRTIDFSKYNLFKITTREFGLRLHDFFKKLNNNDFQNSGRIKSYDLITYDNISNYFKNNIIEFNLYELRDILQWKEYLESYLYDFNKNELIKSFSKKSWDSEEDLKLIKNIISFLDNVVKPTIKKNLIETFSNEVLPFLKVLNGGNSLDESQQKDLIKIIFSDLRIKRNNDKRNLMIGKDTLSTRIMKYFGYEGIDVRGVNGLDNSEYGSVIYDIKQNSIINEQKNKIKLKKLIENTIDEYLNEEFSSNNPSEYGGQHYAPPKDQNSSMDNVVFMFPDMYTENAYRYYSGYGLDDYSVINQIKSVYNKPNKSVKIYRAVPNINKDIDEKIKKNQYILSYKFKYRFYPINNQIVHDLETKVWDKTPSLTYDEMQKEIYNEITNLIDDLIKQKEKTIKINNGDWVTTSKLYAKQHGEANLNNNYKIVTKTVKASQLYTDGNSIFEWGFNI